MVCPLNSFTLASRATETTAIQSSFPHEVWHDADIHIWYEGKRKRSAYLCRDEIAAFPHKADFFQSDLEEFMHQIHPKLKISHKTDYVIIFKGPESISENLFNEKIQRLKNNGKPITSGRVFYSGRERKPETRMVLTNEMIIAYASAYSENEIIEIEKAFEKSHGLIRKKSFTFRDHTLLYQIDNPMDIFPIADQLIKSQQAIYAYPNWFRTRTKRAVPDDPLFPTQWHLDNTGQNGGQLEQDVRIVNAWDTYRGSPDEIIAIVDDGLEIDHEDLAPNLIPGLSWDYTDQDNNPTSGHHGTKCAGIAAGRGWNSMGISGAAPFAGLVGYRLLDAHTVQNEADALTRHPDIVDIYSNSWGPPDTGNELEGPTPLTQDALSYGTSQGRNGLGNIYVWAAGNGGINDNSNYDGYANSRFTIAVSASTNFGDSPNYAEPGANILVNAPSDGGSLNITTTARTGDGEINNNYTNNFGGTSASTSLVSGIIALILEANPDLTWRDVQHILIETAEKNDPTNNGWDNNGAGYPIHYQYGFGRVNASAAVNAAISWNTAEPDVSITRTSNPNITIPDNNDIGVFDTIFIAEDISLEFIEICFSSDHGYWGDLEITLISPLGTLSVLAEGHFVGTNPNSQYNNWCFGTVRHYKESSKGDWILEVKDLYELDTGNFNSWSLILHGTGDIPAMNRSNSSGGGGCFIMSCFIMNLDF